MWQPPFLIHPFVSMKRLNVNTQDHIFDLTTRAYHYSAIIISLKLKKMFNNFI